MKNPTLFGNSKDDKVSIKVNYPSNVLVVEELVISKKDGDRYKNKTKNFKKDRYKKKSFISQEKEEESSDNDESEDDYNELLFMVHEDNKENLEVDENSEDEEEEAEVDL